MDEVCFLLAFAMDSWSQQLTWYDSDIKSVNRTSKFDHSFLASLAAVLKPSRKG